MVRLVFLSLKPAAHANERRASGSRARMAEGGDYHFQNRTKLMFDEKMDRDISNSVGSQTGREDDHSPKTGLIELFGSSIFHRRVRRHYSHAIFTDA
jgi:hypothetical protein